MAWDRFEQLKLRLAAGEAFVEIERGAELLLRKRPAA